MQLLAVGPLSYYYLKWLTIIAVASQNEHWCNTLKTVTDNSTAVACHCTTVPFTSATVLGNPTKIAGYGTTITGEPTTKHTPCSKFYQLHDPSQM